MVEGPGLTPAVRVIPFAQAVCEYTKYAIIAGARSHDE
jgi:hypothetical protein